MFKHLLPLLVVLLACAPGSSSKSPTETPGTEETSFDVSAFSYEDPYAEQFHPLGGSTFAAYRLDEGITTFSRRDASTGNLKTAWPLLTRDDIHEGSAIVSHATTELEAGYFAPTDATTGDVDGDGIEEAVFLGLALNESARAGVRVVQPEKEGGTKAYHQIEDESNNASSWWTGLLAVHGVAGDLDGDGKDELLIAESRATEMQVRVLELGYDGGIPVFATRWSAVYPGFFGRVEVGQFDDDLALEFVVAHGTPTAVHQVGVSGAADVSVDLHDDLNAGGAFLSTVETFAGYDTSFELCVGNFDGDAKDELVIGIKTWLKTLAADYHELRTWVFAYDIEAGVGTRTAQRALNDPNEPGWHWDAIGQTRRDRLVAADLAGNGVETVSWVRAACDEWSPFSGSFGQGTTWDIAVMMWRPDTDGLTQRYLQTTDFGVIFGGGNETTLWGVDLARVDDDGTGDDNLLVTVSSQDGAFAGSPTMRQYLVFDASSHFDVGLLSAEKRSIPIMTGGDYDGESLRLRYTGVKYPELADPIPMVVISAPPTKAGIDQNYDSTGSTYATSQGSGQAYSVSSALSASYEQGMEWEDITGTFGASVKEKLTWTTEKSTGSSSTVTNTTIFSGGYDEDSIVFEGTLHTVYEYEIVGAQNPAVVGTTLALNVPVSTRVFKWTLDYFNANVDPADQITLLGHTIGDPTSYATRPALQAKLQSGGGAFEGWEGTLATVGQGSSSNGTSWEMSEVLTEGSSHSFGVELSAEFKVGSAKFGGSVGVSSSSMYEVSVTSGTAYEGTVGDIGADDWLDWFYDFGMVIYTKDDVAQPYQVLEYWVDPTGAAY